MTPDTSKYLEYLDREMTIMGILSAVSMIAAAGVLNVFMGDKGDIKSDLWEAGQHCIVLGSMVCVVAAGLFYKQRSRLAWFYGQICLLAAAESGTPEAAKLRELFREADSWETWWPYSWGFTFLTAGFVGYVLAFVAYWVHSLRGIRQVILGCLLVMAAFVVAGLQRYVLTRHKWQDDPWSSFRSDLRQRVLKRQLPHEKVYTRLKPSPISGIGVFAIRDIPRDTYAFQPDDDELVSVKKSEIPEIGNALRRLYTDFCVLNDGTYQCPSNFNRLTPGWYLNESKNPNMAADLNLRFYAIRDIPEGEELTVDYATY
jgi:hypothetical protein